MPKSLAKIGQEEFEKNKTNFLKAIKQIITKDESPFDESTIVKVYFNIDNDLIPYFKFDVSTFRMELSTDYYQYDYNFKEGTINNVDEIIANQDDVHILTYYGDEI